MVEQMIEDLAGYPNPQRSHPGEIALELLSGDVLLHKQGSPHETEIIVR